MINEQYIVEQKDELYLAPNGKWYNKCMFEHLQEHSINGKIMLMEYYVRISDEIDNKLLDGWQVWIYGNDRPQNPPHCHLIKDEYNIEVHLHDMQLYHMESPTKQLITWDGVSKELYDGFFAWLNQTSNKDVKHTNAEYLLLRWDDDNSSNTLQKFIEEKGLGDRIHPIVREYVYGKLIMIDDVIKAIFNIVFPIYKADKKKREEFHKINDPIEFAQVVGLPFEFTEYNTTSKICQVIKDYEKMCYEMTTD